MVTPISLIGQPDQSANQVSGSGTIQRITQAIKQASARTGVDFSYLLNKASQESGFNPNAQASSSSAAGLFQFTSQTWLQTVKTYGSKFGLGAYANDITMDSNGVAHVSDPSAKQAILALRKDPTVSAEMSGELDQQNCSALKSDVGGSIGPTDLYLAHFLGASGASNFINTLRSNPNANAAALLPEAASANPSVFYNSNGQARSVSQIYQQFAQKFDNPPQVPQGVTTTAVASRTPAASVPSGSFSVADAANGLAKQGRYAPRATDGVKPNTSSLYQAMVLAQMNMHEAGLSALGSANSGTTDMTGSDHKKGSPISILAGVA